MGAGVMQNGGGGRRRGRRRSRARPMSEINVTPFIDVMLVLLIIFMVAAPLALNIEKWKNRERVALMRDALGAVYASSMASGSGVVGEQAAEAANASDK